MDLPENVLENIFKYLEVKQQFELASTNEYCNTIMQNVWRYSDQEAFLKIDSNLRNEELRSILMQTHQYLGKIAIYKCNIEKWNIVKQYRYPKAKELSIDNEIILKDAEQYITLFPDISDLFPNLKSLRIFVNMVFRDRDINNLIKLKSLEDLDVSGTFTRNSFQKMFEELKLKSLNVGNQRPFPWTSKKAFINFCALERFQNRSNWNMLQPNILKLSNLKEIWGFADNGENIELKEIFRDIVEHKPHNITKIILGSVWSLEYLLRHTFPNLRRLEILYQNMNKFTDVFKCAPNLREIVFFCCINVQEEHIKEILKSTQIEFFDVHECGCNFKTISIDVNDIVKGRTKPLSFHFSGWLYPEVVTSFHDSLKIECKFEGKSPLFKKMDMVDRNREFVNYGVEFQ